MLFQALLKIWWHFAGSWAVGLSFVQLETRDFLGKSCHRIQRSKKNIPVLTGHLFFCWLFPSGLTKAEAGCQKVEALIRVARPMFFASFFPFSASFYLNAHTYRYLVLYVA